MPADMDLAQCIMDMELHRCCLDACTLSCDMVRQRKGTNKLHVNMVLLQPVSDQFTMIFSRKECHRVIGDDTDPVGDSNLLSVRSLSFYHAQISTSTCLDADLLLPKYKAILCSCGFLQLIVGFTGISSKAPFLPSREE